MIKRKYIAAANNGLMLNKNLIPTDGTQDGTGRECALVFDQPATAVAFYTAKWGCAPDFVYEMLPMKLVDGEYEYLPTDDPSAK